jgi:hypothetical protein
MAEKKVTAKKLSPKQALKPKAPLKGKVTPKM